MNMLSDWLLGCVRLRANVSFDYWGPRGERDSVVRFVTSWATTDEDVDRLCEILR